MNPKRTTSIGQPPLTSIGLVKSILTRTNLWGVVLVFLTCWFWSFPCCAQASQSSWTAFRGSESTGATDQAVMTSNQKHLEVVWSAQVPGSGHSSPVVQDSIVYLSTSYLPLKGRLTFIAAHWTVALAMVVLAWLVFLRYAAVPLSAGRIFSASFHLGLLFLLATVGTDLLGCRNDTFRTVIFCVVILTVALDTLRTLTIEWPTMQVCLAGAGLIAAGAAAFHVLHLPTLRQPKLMFAVCLLPLACTLLCGQSLLNQKPLVWRWVMFVPLLAFIVAPLLVVGGVSYRYRDLAFWKIQPVAALNCSTHYVGGAAAMFLAGLVLYWMGRSLRPARIPGLALLAWSTLLALPILLAPLINSSSFLKYQLVRGSLISPLGTTGLLTACALLVLSCTAAFMPLRWSQGLSHSRFTNAVLCLVPLAAALLPVLGDRLGNSGGTICALIAYDAHTGGVRWATEGLTSRATGSSSSFNSPATPTPVIVSNLVVAYFGEAGTFACERNSGALSWTYLDLPYRTDYGVASSLAGTHSLIVVQSDSDRSPLDKSPVPSYVVALSTHNGRPAWRQAHNDVEGPCWRTPTVFDWHGRPIVAAWWGAQARPQRCDFLAGDTGELLRRLHGVDCGPEDPVSSPVVAGNRIFLVGTDRLIVVSLAQLFQVSTQSLQLNLGAGIAPSKENAWPKLSPEFCVALDGTGPTCSTPAFDGQRLFAVSDTGTLWCFSIQEGKVIWRTEIGDAKSSPVVAGRHLYAVTDKGIVHAFDLSGSKPVPVATLDLGEEVKASPAAVAGSLFVRTRTRLCCLRGTN